jgi:hypothetical protein
MVLVRTQNNVKTFGGVVAILGTIATIVSYGGKLLNTIAQILPTFSAIQQSNQIKSQFADFINQFRRNPVLRSAIEKRFAEEYKDAPEFWNAIVDRDLKRTNLFDPVKIGEILIEQHPKCIAIFSGNCKNEHLKWIDKIQTFSDYITDLAKRMELAIKSFEEFGRKFDALSYQEQISYLVKNTPKKGEEITTAGFGFNPQMMYFFFRRFNFNFAN